MKTKTLIALVIALGLSRFALAADQSAFPRFDITPKDVRQASIIVSPSEPSSFLLVLTKEKAEKLAAFTKENIDKQVLVTVCDTDLASPFIKAVISDPKLTLQIGSDLPKYVTILESLSK